MFLHNLFENISNRKKFKRLWRWNASGKWNYSTRWIKGQKSRSWYSKNPGFEGWQTPLNKRLPKLRWFKRYFKLVEDYEIVNISDLEQSWKVADGDNLDKTILFEKGLISSTSKAVKILWRWDISKKLVFNDIEKFSLSAKEKIEKAWGSIQNS